MGKQELGKKGEELAEAYLRNRGCRILARNWSFRSVKSGKLLGEVDLIAQRGGDTIFVEVKAGRRSEAAFRPEIHVSRAKLQKIRQTAQRWLAIQGRSDTPWQVDVIAIDFFKESDPPRLRHIPRVVIE
ncbi:MAG: hypothetical protein A2991_04220 [Candidatus Terrybacteria bacterium RIFCSPLOWO2_01_FULL_58_14]|uniref:UPF0102 protein A2991_04220 n=2 Tax=Candidatus Terryibacteriota TaxID=1817920 RepID=A0A1G2PW19_9BACT|nr:MAG: hypothetical protein A2682_03370 [Candidatus Terrybacteria bacterium RIFCSPHIGHO2_01_FULL_58_15]OHA52520.1 MAG: hypothetical protein A2991_04220 [Candidatus Terrybacteria bacterium RIFCSPLOWO2_01_FULL_58_14]